jgi:hypothetical protein
VSTPAPTSAPSNQSDEVLRLQSELAQLKAENQAMREASARMAKAGMSMKISEKGGLSVYGLGRFPTTLYASQWEKLNAMMPTIMTFLTENKEFLKAKEAVAKDK